MTSRATAAAATRAHKRVKRAQGLVRAAAALLAEARDLGDADLVAELRLEQGEPLDLRELVNVLEVARARTGGALDVVVLASPRTSSPPAPHAPRPEPETSTLRVVR